MKFSHAHFWTGNRHQMHIAQRQLESIPPEISLKDSRIRVDGHLELAG